MEGRGEGECWEDDLLQNLLSNEWYLGGETICFLRCFREGGYWAYLVNQFST